MSGETSIIPDERIRSAIFLIRGQKVVLDRDLAGLYGVETFNLNKAVEKEQGALPFRFHVSTNPRRIRKLEIPFWNIKLGRHAKAALCLHRAWGGNALKRSEQ